MQIARCEPPDEPRAGLESSVILRTPTEYSTRGEVPLAASSISHSVVPHALHISDRRRRRDNQTDASPLQCTSSASGMGIVRIRQQNPAEFLPRAANQPLAERYKGGVRIHQIDNNNR